MYAISAQCEMAAVMTLFWDNMYLVFTRLDMLSETFDVTFRMLNVCGCWKLLTCHKVLPFIALYVTASRWLSQCGIIEE